MVRVTVDPEIFGDMNPTEIQRACAVLKQRLGDHPDPTRLRAKRRWQETVEFRSGSACDRYIASCAIKYEGTEWYVDVTTLRKQRGQRGNPLARR